MRERMRQRGKEAKRERERGRKEGRNNERNTQRETEEERNADIVVISNRVCPLNSRRIARPDMSNSYNTIE